MTGRSVHADISEDDLMEMSLEELMNVEIVSSGSLTRTTRMKSPATVTTLTQEEIQRIGARSLDELLLICVPNVQIIHHKVEYKHMGMRGINSDREDKYLLLVNGKILNERTNYGVMAERDLPMMADIHHIDIVHGPGSAMYGPGAIAMVINIITDTALTFEGTQMRTRIAGMERHYTGELKWGKQYDEDHGLLLYAGVSQYPGASGADAPLVRSYASNGVDIKDYVENDEVGGNRSFRTDQPKVKLHGHYNRGGLQAWARYTKGGQYQNYNETNRNAKKTYGASAYQQISAYLSYRKEINPQASLLGAFAYDLMERDYLKAFAWTVNTWREDEYYSKLMLSWNPDDRHHIALGGEWSHEICNLPGLGYPEGQDPYFTRVKVASGPSVYVYQNDWTMDLYGLVGEYQWRMTDDWTAFFGGRMDKHSYMGNTIYSPRAALVHTPGDRDSWRFMYTKSSRINHYRQLREDWQLHNYDPNNPLERGVERIQSFEVRYERQHNERLWLAGSVFYYHHEPVGWGGGTLRTTALGDVYAAGLELEATYKTERFRVTGSHAFTKMTDFDMVSGVDPRRQVLTAAPITGDDEFTNWDDHITKVRAVYNVTPQWSVDTSMHAYWGSRGAQDFVDYQEMTGTQELEIYDFGLFWNLGLQYEPSRTLTLRVEGFNLLGFFDKDLNMERFQHQPGKEQKAKVQSPALGLSLVYYIPN